MNPEEVEVSLNSGKTLNLTFEELQELRSSDTRDSVKESYYRQLTHRSENFFDFEAEDLFFEKNAHSNSHIRVTLHNQLGQHPYGVPFLRFREPQLTDHISPFSSRNEEVNYWELGLSRLEHKPIDKAHYSDTFGIERLVQRLKETSADILAVEQALSGYSTSAGSYEDMRTSRLKNFITKIIKLPAINYANFEPLKNKEYSVYNVSVIDPELLRLIRIPGLALVSHPYKSLQHIDKDIRGVGYLPLTKKENFGSQKERIVVTKRWGKFVGKLPKNITSIMMARPYNEEPPTQITPHRTRGNIYTYPNSFGLINFVPLTIEERELILPIATNDSLSPYEKSVETRSILSTESQA